MKKIFKIMGVILVVFITAAVILHFSTTNKNKYASYMVAQNAGAVKNGWIPKCLPESAYNISETHNDQIDPVKGSGEFFCKDCSLTEDAPQVTAEQISDDWTLATMKKRVKEGHKIFKCDNFLIDWIDNNHGVFYINVSKNEIKK